MLRNSLSAKANASNLPRSVVEPQPETVVRNKLPFGLAQCIASINESILGKAFQAIHACGLHKTTLNLLAVLQDRPDLADHHL